MSNNSWKQYGGISKTDNFNTINASTIIADQFISRSTRPTYQFFNGTFETSYDLSAGVNLLAGNSIYSSKDIFVNRDLYTNNKLFFGNNTFQNDGNNFPALSTPNTYAYLYGNSSNIGVNTILPKTVFNITGTVGSVTDILTVESGNVYIRNIIAQNVNKRGVVIDADDVSSNILFYNDVATDKPNVPDAKIKYEDGGILTTRTSNLILNSARTVRIDTSGGQLVMDSTKTALTSAGYLSMDISGNISLKGGSNIVLDISRSKITLNENKSIIVDTSNEFIVNYPSGNLKLNGDGTTIDAVRDVNITSSGIDNAGGNIKLDTKGGSITMNSKELLLNAKLKFSSLDRTILNYNAYDETITVFDNSHQTLLYNVYKDDSIKYGHSINCVGIDGSASTFIHMTPANTKRGGTIGGGLAPYDTSRSITMIGTTDICGNYNNSHLTVSGKNTHKYLSTVGINTFQPKTEDFVLDVNGAMHIGNGEINEIIKTDFEIKHVSIAKAPYSNYGIAVGSPKTSVTNSDTSIQSYQQVLLYTTNGGKTWNQSNVYQLPPTTDDFKATFYNCFMLDDKYGIVSGERGYIFITNNSGVSWYQLILLDQTNIPISTNPVIQTAVITNNASRLIMTYKNIGSSSTTGIYFFDVASLSTLFTSASNYTKSIAPTAITIGHNIQSNPERTTNGFMVTSTSVTNTFSYFAGDGIARYKNAALAAGVPYSDIEAYTIPTNAIYYGISAFDDTHVIAVGDKKISSTVDGITWTHKTTASHGLGDIVLKSVVACDASNAIAIGSQGELIYSYNWGDSAPLWAFVPDSILNTSGAKKMLSTGTGHLQNICMVELSAFIIVNVISDFVDGATDLTDVAGESKILYCYLPNLFNNLNNNVLDVSGSIAITGQVKVYNGELLINTVNSNADNKPAFDARTLNIGSKTHIVNIGLNDDKLLIEQELNRDFDTGSSVINIGVVDPSNSNSTAVLINIGNYNSSKTNRKSNLINIGGGKDITSIGGTVVYTNNSLIASRGKGLQINDFNLGLAIATYISNNDTVYNDSFLPNAVFLPNVFYFIYDFRSNPTSTIRNYLIINVITLISGYINLKNRVTTVYTPTKLPAGITATYVANTITTGSYDISKYNVDFESYVLQQYISYYLTTYNIEFYTVNIDTNMVQVSVSGVVTSLDILYTSYPDYYYPVPFTEAPGGYDDDLESFIINTYQPFRTSKGAGIFVTDNTDRQAGHIRVSEDMNGWVMKPPNPNSNVVKFDINGLTLNNDSNINPGLGVHAIKSGLVVLNRPTGTDIIDSSYVLSVKQFDISNILIRDSIDSTDNQQVIKTNVLIGNSLDISNQLYVGKTTILNGDAAFNGNIIVGRDVSMNGKLSIASDVSINGNISIKGTLESTTYQSNYIINTVTNDYEFIITTDMSMSGNLFIKGDVSLNSDMDVKGYIAVGKHNPVVSVDISYTDAIRIPIGTTSDRPIDYNGSGGLVLKNNVPFASPTDKNKYIGAIRYNTDNKQFEGFGPADSWSSLGSVSNISQNTTIIAASPNPGSTNNDLLFYTANKNKVLISDKRERMRIDGSGNVGIGTIAPECTFHVDISNNPEENTIAGLFTNSNLKPTYNVDMEKTINKDIATYINTYKTARNAYYDINFNYGNYSLSGITGTSVSNYAYDYYYHNTHFEDYAIKEYIAKRDFKVNPPYGTYLPTLTSTAYTYGFGGPYDVSFNMDIETYVRNNMNTILTTKSLSIPNLGFQFFTIDKENGYFTNPTIPGIFRSGTSSVNYRYSYYDFTDRNADYTLAKEYLYEGYYNYITNIASQRNIYSIGALNISYPPIAPTITTNTGTTYVGTISGRSYGNGEYSITSNQDQGSYVLSCLFDNVQDESLLPGKRMLYTVSRGTLKLFFVLPDSILLKTMRIYNNNAAQVFTLKTAANIGDDTGTLLISQNGWNSTSENTWTDYQVIGGTAAVSSNTYLLTITGFVDTVVYLQFRELQFVGNTNSVFPFGVNAIDSRIGYTFIDNCNVVVGNDNKHANNAANIVYSYINNQSNQSALSFGFTQNENKMLIRADGKVGIGTTSPGSFLTVQGDTYIAAGLFVGDDVSMNNRLYVLNDVSFMNKLQVSNNVTFNNRLYVANDVTINNRLYVANDASFMNKLYVANDASFNNNVDIRGYVGIGKSNPVVALDISYTDAIHIPSGTNAERPIKKEFDTINQIFIYKDESNVIISNADKNKYIGSIRYNNENQQFEGFGPGNDWNSLNGSFNISQNTKILTSFPLPNSTNNELMFFTAPTGNVDPTGGIERMRITSSGDISMNNRLYVLNDVSLNNNLYVKNKLTVDNDVSLNNQLYVLNNVTLNNRLLVRNDVSINGVLQVDSSVNIYNTLTLSKGYTTSDPLGLIVNADVSFGGNLLLKNNFISNGNIATNGNIYSSLDRDLSLFDLIANGNAYTKTIHFGRSAKEINIMNVETPTQSKTINIGYSGPNIGNPLASYDTINMKGNTIMQGDTYIRGTKLSIDTPSNTISGNLTISNGNVVMNNNLTVNGNTGISGNVIVSGVSTIFNSATTEIKSSNTIISNDLNVRNLTIGGTLVLPTATLNLKDLTVTGEFVLGITKATANFVFQTNDLLLRNGTNLSIQGVFEVQAYNFFSSGSTKALPFFTVDTRTKIINVQTMNNNLTFTNDYLIMDTNVGGSGFIIYQPNKTTYTLPILSVRGAQVAIGKETNSAVSDRMLDVSGTVLISKDLDVGGKLTITGDINIGNANINLIKLFRTSNPSLVWNIVPEVNDVLAIYAAQSGNPQSTNLVEIRNKLNITGPVGIGRGSAINALDVSGGVAIGASYAGTSTAPINGLLVEGKVGIGRGSAINALDVSGGVAIGASYAGTNNVPINGLLVQGNVCIGTTSPISNALFNVDISYSTQQFWTGVFTNSALGNTSCAIAVGKNLSDNNAGEFKFTNSANPTTDNMISLGFAGNGDILQVKSNKTVIINGNTSAGVYALNVTGNMQANSYNASSDFRLKTNIQSLTDSLDLVNQLNGVSFTWKSDTTNKPVLGLIAQDVEKVLPEIVNTATTDNEHGYKQKSIHYDGLFPHLIESIKTLTKENKALVSNVEVLTQENKALVAKVDKIMTILDKLNISV
jgi:UDP-3-O-[3-hydroxymyristoyl] glucosamine N-acyltransferase